MANNPLVSVIIPSFNQGRFIRQTIDSILMQDYRPLEILVIDGASNDETIDVLRSFGNTPEFNWVSEPDRGVVEAVNKGFDRASGDIIAIQSSDDRYLAGAISTVVQCFEDEPKLGLVYGDTVKVDAEGREIQRYRIGPWSLQNLFLLKTWIPQPSCFFRRQIREAVGGWDERIPYSPDTDMWIRMAFRTNVRKIDVYLSERRIHDAQRDTQAARIVDDYRRMIEQSPDIASAPKALRNAARAGCELMFARYNPSGSRTIALWHDFKAVIICPRAFSAKRWWVNGVIIPLRILLQPLAPMKRWLGCWLNERWKTEVALGPLAKRARLEWRDLCNRHEFVEQGDDAPARYVETEHTSYLTVARQFPRVGGRLAQKCFEEHPLPVLNQAELESSADPGLSIILPVGGEDRLCNFQCVLESLINQSLSEIEIIVLEHSEKPIYEAVLPQGVRYLHVEMSGPQQEFNKSMLLNRGVELSRTAVVLLHDADILVPFDYLEQSFRHIASGFEAVRPLRFLFYLDEQCTCQVVSDRGMPEHYQIDAVAQNSQGGSTLIRKDVYFEIGGHDERFEGWGGEDLEFHERLRTRKLFKGGFMPAAHLWHRAAQKKASGDKNQQILSSLRTIEPMERIERLRAANTRPEE